MTSTPSNPPGTSANLGESITPAAELLEKHGEEALLAAGARFGRYVIVRLIGTGGMGAVYEATHADLKKRVALKIIHPTFATQGEVQARFLREGEVASKIRHAHVVDMTDFGVRDGVPYLVMEYLEGESLSERLVHAPPVTLTEVVDIMLPVCAAVHTAHEEGVVHRDLKPANVFLVRTRHGEAHPKVVDFGVSKLLHDTSGHNLTASSSLLGSPSYMSPEQIRANKHVDARTDQYALGVVLYESLTGAKPFVAETLYGLMHLIVQGQMATPRSLRADIPVGLEAVILRSMQLSPDERFPTVHAMGAALLPFASQRTQMLWQPVFAEPARQSTQVSPSDAVRPSATQLSSPTALRALVTGPTELPGGSTLAQSGREIDAKRPQATARGSRLGLWIGAGAALALAGVGVTVMRGRESSGTRASSEARTAASAAPTAQPYRAIVVVHPEAATVEVDGESAGVGLLDRSFPRDGTEHSLRVQAPGFQPRVVTFRDAPPPRVIELVAAAPVAPPSGSALVEPSAVAAPVPVVGTPALPAVPGRPGARVVRTGPGGRPNGAATELPAGTPPPSSVGVNGAAILP